MGMSLACWKCALKFITLNYRKIRMLETVVADTRLYKETCTDRRFARSYLNPIGDEDLLEQGLATPQMDRAGRTKIFFDRIVDKDLHNSGGAG